MRQLKWLSLLGLLLLGPSTYAQSVRFQSQAISSRGAGIANATVAVCTQPSNTNTQPCSPLATLATSTSTTSGGANPLTADSFGNFFFYAAPGRYTVQIYGPAVSGQFVLPDVELTSSTNINSVNGIPIVNVSTFPNVQTALNSLNGTAGIVFVPPGTWAPAAANTPLTLTNSFQRIICAGMDSTVIQYSGTTNITAVVDVGTADNGTAQQVNDAVTNCTISGNSHTTYALRVRGTHRSDFSHNKLINAVTAGLFSDFAVADTWDDLHTSTQEQTLTVVPVNCFIFDGPDTSHRTTASLVKNPVCEGVSGTGIVLNNASSITINGGTSEQNNKGITLGTGALDNILDGVDIEANTTSNVEDGGTENSFRNLVGNGKYITLGTAVAGYWIGAVYDTIQINTGANFTILDYVFYNNSGAGTFTDSGTNTQRHWVQKTSVGQNYGDFYGTCVFAAATSCAVTFNPTWITAPLVFIQPVNAGAVTFTISVPTTTGFTITASAANSLTVNWNASLH